MSPSLSEATTEPDLVPAVDLDVRAELRRRFTIPVWSSDPAAMTVATVMGWSRSAAYKAVNDGNIPSVKVSRNRYAVSTLALLAFIDGAA